MIRASFVQREFEDGIGIRKNLTVGLPMTPSSWMGDAIYTPVSRIKMSCGGGMGGSSWYETVERIDIDNVDLNKPLIVTTIDGNKKMLNPRYIVLIDSEITRVTRKLNNKNDNYPIGIYTYSWLIRDGKEITFENYYC